MDQAEVERQGVVCPSAPASHGQITKQIPDSPALAAVLFSGNRALLRMAAAFTGVSPESPGQGPNPVYSLVSTDRSETLIFLSESE